MARVLLLDNDAMLPGMFQDDEVGDEVPLVYRYLDGDADPGEYSHSPTLFFRMRQAREGRPCPGQEGG